LPTTLPHMVSEKFTNSDLKKKISTSFPKPGQCCGGEQ